MGDPKRLARGAAILAALLSFAAAAPAAGSSGPEPPRAAADWRDPRAWDRLRVGMSELDVLRILGAPGRITRYYAFERWEYPDALGRRVNFDERGRLVAWGDRAR